MKSGISKKVRGYGGSTIEAQSFGAREVYIETIWKGNLSGKDIRAFAYINRSSAIALRDALTRIVARMPRRKGAK